MAQTSQEIIIDTNILIDYLRNFPQAEEFLNSLENRPISSITAMEVIKGATNKEKLEVNLFFLDDFEVINIDEVISDQAIDLMERYNLKYDLTIMDALIASTALAQNRKLITRNVKDFKGIEGIEIYQPY